ncbi:hypothetical protein TIFTF001_055385, partial [Ficus carica]
SLEKNCGGEYYENIDPSNIECLEEFQAFQKSVLGIWSKFILDSDCNSASSKSQEDSISGRRLLNQNFEVIRSSESLLSQFGCPDYPELLSNYWANDPDVRQALHVRKGSVGEWKRCNYGFPYERNVRSSVEYHANLSAK